MYGHPHDETLERLEEAGAGVIRTDESGAIEIRVIEDKLQTFVYGDGCRCPTKFENIESIIKTYFL